MGRNTRLLTRALLVAAPLLLHADTARAQPAVDSVHRNGNGTYTVVIDGAPHVALGEAALRRTAAREDSLRTALAKIEELERIVAAREAGIAALDRQIAAGEALMSAQRDQLSTQDRLVQELRRSIGGGFSVDVGGGFSREDGAAGLAAVSWNRWGVWGLAGRDRGLTAGVKLRLLQF